MDSGGYFEFLHAVSRKCTTVTMMSAQPKIMLRFGQTLELLKDGLFFFLLVLLARTLLAFASSAHNRGGLRSGLQIIRGDRLEDAATLCEMHMNMSNY